MSIEATISDKANYGQMQKIERDVFEALKPYRNGRTEAMLVVFALIRVARMLLKLYPEKDQHVFRPLIVAFFKEEIPDTVAQGNSPLWLPPSNLN